MKVYRDLKDGTRIVFIILQDKLEEKPKNLAIIFTSSGKKLINNNLEPFYLTTVSISEKATIELVIKANNYPLLYEQEDITEEIKELLKKHTTYSLEDYEKFILY